MSVSGRTIERGRFAPSPTGELHLGNARTALLAWLSARSRGARFTMRIEDLDRPRCRPGLAEKQLEELAWLGLDWDEGPESAPPHTEAGPHGPYRQSQRGPLYDRAIEQLREGGHVYDCFCSRAQIRAAADALHSNDRADATSEASAPHGPQDDGPRYPGTCANLTAAEVATRRKSRAPALRLRVPHEPISFDDAIAGPQQFDPATEVGDFILRRADGVHAYQLAVVVDDAAMEITEVVRGADLLASTARQMLLYRMLGLRIPSWAHVPLLFGPPGIDGQPQRLSKRAGAETLSTMRARGDDPRTIVAQLARSSSLVGDEIAACTPAELLPRFALARLSR